MEDLSKPRLVDTKLIVKIVKLKEKQQNFYLNKIGNFLSEYYWAIIIIVILGLILYYRFYYLEKSKKTIEDNPEEEVVEKPVYYYNQKIALPQSQEQTREFDPNYPPLGQGNQVQVQVNHPQEIRLDGPDPINLKESEFFPETRMRPNPPPNPMDYSLMGRSATQLNPTYVGRNFSQF